MSVLKKILFGVALLILLMMGIGLLLPSEFEVERRIQIKAPAAKVYADIADLKKWREWGVWFKRDPDMQVTYTGEPFKVGMKSAWVSASEGSGEMQILSLTPETNMTYSLYFPEFELGSTGEFSLSESDGTTLVVWRDYGDVGGNPINRYFALMMDSMVGPDFEAGLSRLKKRIEASE